LHPRRTVPMLHLYIAQKRINPLHQTTTTTTTTTPHTFPPSTHYPLPHCLLLHTHAQTPISSQSHATPSPHPVTRRPQPHKLHCMTPLAPCPPAAPHVSPGACRDEKKCSCDELPKADASSGQRDIPTCRALYTHTPQLAAAAACGRRAWFKNGALLARWVFFILCWA
jgi:hypothetical protein